MSELSVEPDGIDRHAASVNGLSSGLSEASGAIAHIHASGDAFGVMMEPILPPALNAVFPTVSAAVQVAAHTVEKTAQGLKEMARDYREVDEEQRRRFGGLGM